MLAGDREDAVRTWRPPAANGVPDLAAVAADPLFAPLAGDPRLAGTRRLPAPPPATGRRSPRRWRTARRPGLRRQHRLGPRHRTARAALRPSREDHRAPVAAAGAEVAAYDLLCATHYRHGRAAGNLGDLYDNRDRGHSALDPAAHPQLTRVTYSAAARAADLDYGLNDRLLLRAR